MEESINTHGCKINYDDFNNISHRDIVKFRRCYGSVKLNPREGDDVEGGDEFGVIIDKIQDVNEDVFLTRECNNFDLINLDCSQNSLTSTRCVLTGSDLNEHVSSEYTDKKFTHLNDLIDPQYKIEIKLADDALQKQLIDFCSQIRNDKPYNDGVSECGNINSEENSNLVHCNSDKSESIIEITSEPTVRSIFTHTEQIEETDSHQVPRRGFIDMKSVRFLEEEDIMYSPLHRKTSSSIDEKSGKYDTTEELDSDDSSKWDHQIHDMPYNAGYFYNSINAEPNRFQISEGGGIKTDQSETASALLLTSQITLKTSTISQDPENIGRESFLNDDFENDSLKSDISLSASSTFESAMSSNDMMSPFGTPRNSLSKHSSLGGSCSLNKKPCFNFASFTSENIPNTLNRISMHKATENKKINKSADTNNESTEKKERDLTQNIDYNKVYSSHSIRKLLNLTSHKKAFNHFEIRVPEKLPCRKEISNESQVFKKDLSRTVCLGSQDKKINLKEFYLSRRSKLRSLTEQEKLNIQNMNNDTETKKNPFSNINTQSLKRNRIGRVEENCKNDFDDESLNIISVIPKQSKESKSKFMSKIPRPVSRKEVRHKSVAETILELPPYLEKCEKDEGNQISRPSSDNVAIFTSKSDKSETPTRLSDGSESSYKAPGTVSKVKDHNNNIKIGSKTIVNVTQIGNLRSKYWIKDKFGISSVVCNSNKSDKKIEVKEKRKVKSNVYVSPQSVRQESRLAYGKMVRVKTAPIRGTLQIRERSVVRESSKPDTICSWKSGRKPSKVVSIGALNVNNKIH